MYKSFAQKSKKKHFVAQHWFYCQNESIKHILHFSTSRSTIILGRRKEKNILPLKLYLFASVREEGGDFPLILFVRKVVKLIIYENMCYIGYKGEL